MKTSKNWFYRLLLSYLPVFFVVSSVIIILSFLVIVQLSQRQAQNANELFSQTIMTSIDQSLHSIDYELIQDIQTDDKLSQFFNSDTNAYFLNYQVSQKLSAWMASHPLIDSAYLVRWSDGLIITQSGLIPIADFADRSFVLQERNKPLPLYWTNDRTVTLDTSGEPKTVISLARKVPLQSGSQGMVIVNIRTESIEKFIKDSKVFKFGFLTIMGSNGQRILGTEPKTDFNDSSISTVVKSSYTGWEFLSGVKDYRIFSFTSVFSYVWIALGLLVTILGVVWIIYVTRRNYKPIESILEQMQKYIREKSQHVLESDKLDEFTFIESTFENLIGELSNFQKNTERDRIIRSKHLFHELMTGGFAGDDKELLTEMSELGLFSKEVPVQFLVSIAEIDRFHAFSTHYSASDQYLLQYVLTKAIQEISDSHSLGIWCEWMSNSRLTLMIFLNHELDPIHLAEKVNDYWGEVLSWMERYLPFTITIGIGSQADHVDDFQNSYHDAVEVLRYKWILEKRIIIWKNDVNLKSVKELFYYQHLIGSFAYSFRIGDSEWRSLFERLFTEVKQGILARDDMVSLLNNLLFILDRELSNLNIAKIDSMKENSLSYIRDEIDGLENITDIQNNMKTILTELSDNIQQLRESQSNYSMIHEVRTFIEQNYQNPDLSLVSVSEEFDMNGNYLSRLFKEEFGETFVNYLMKLRVDQAKQLLTETLLPIQQIANLVGYTHSVSFNRVFKKFVGRTPGEYRSQTVVDN